MATSLDQVNAERAVKANKGKKFSSDDVELAVNLGVKVLNEGNGLQLIEKAINQSQDPAQVVGQFLTQIIAKLAEQLRGEYGIDPGIFLAKDGFLDYILNYIEKKLGYPEEFSDQIYGQVLEIIKAAAMSPPAPNDVMSQGQPPAGGAPAPVAEPQPGQMQQPQAAPPQGGI